MIDFIIQQNRKNSQCAKWDEVDQYFGGSDLLPLWIADTDFQTPSHIIESLKKRLEHPVLNYATPSDLLYQNIISFYEQHAQFSFKKEDIIISNGVIPLVAAMVLAFTKEDDEIIFQTPGYGLLKNTIVLNHRTLLENPLLYNNQTGDYTLDFESLERSITPKTKMWIFCNPHNPTSRVWTKQEIKEIERITLKYDLLIVSDEIHGFLNYPSHPYTPLASISDKMKERTITMSSPGKMFGISGLICAFGLLHNKELKKTLETQILASGLSFSKKNALGLIATEAAYDQQSYPWLKTQIQYLEDNSKHFYDVLKKEVPEIVVTPIEASFLAWVNLNPLGLDPDDLYHKMIHKAKLAIYEGRIFSDHNKGFYRVNIGCSRETLDIALEKIILLAKDR